MAHPNVLTRMDKNCKDSAHCIAAREIEEWFDDSFSIDCVVVCVPTERAKGNLFGKISSLWTMKTMHLSINIVMTPPSRLACPETIIGLDSAQTGGTRVMLHLYCVRYYWVKPSLMIVIFFLGLSLMARSFRNEWKDMDQLQRVEHVPLLLNGKRISGT